MNSNEIREQVIKFIKENGFECCIKQFCMSERVRKIAKAKHDLLIEDVKVFVDGAPKSMKSIAEKASKEVNEYTFEFFCEDIEMKVMAYVYVSTHDMLEMSEASDFRKTVIESARNAIDADNQVLLKWLDNQCSEMIEEIMFNFVNAVWRC